MPWLVGALDDVGRRRAERVRDQPGRVGQGHLDMLAGHRVQPAEHAVAGRAVLGQRRHAQPGQRLLDEVPVPRRDQLAQVGRGSLGGLAGGHHDVDAVGPPGRVRVHPVQRGVQVGRVVEPDAAEHAQPARPADGRRDMLGRGEADDRVLDAEQVAQRGPHGRRHLAGRRRCCPLAAGWLRLTRGRAPGRRAGGWRHAGGPSRSQPCPRRCARWIRPARCCAAPCTRRSGRGRASRAWPGPRPRPASAAPGPPPAARGARRARR